jgi:small subunit ribosomal protein S17
MPEKKTTTGKAGASKSTSASAKQPAAKKPAAKKPVTKKSTATKAASKAAQSPATKSPARARKISTARAEAKAQRPAPARIPGRKERRGVVVSDAMDKTIVVRVDSVVRHDLYGKVVRRSKKLHVHDELNSAGLGDVVRVVETRPLSATKRWRLVEIVEKAK